MNAFIQGALDRGVRPKRTATDALYLRRTGGGIGPWSTPTGSGRARGAGTSSWRTRASPAEGYDASQRPVRQGNAETIRVRGKEKTVRRYDPATNDWVYTKLGRQFYSRRQAQWVVKVPATFSGTRSNGNPTIGKVTFPSRLP
jgi:hypothetical protein